MPDTSNAFVKEDFEIQPTGEGKLQGRIFAVKDVFSVRGWTNTAGNPDWLRSHGPAEENAEAIDRLLENGARLRGITHTDELMFSLNGENIHYGTPVNPVAPGRIPGGSSSGSAAAAAAELADFALGTDTGGSVRVPSAYCGLYGFRPTHGAVSMRGVIPLAPSFDTVGWMSGDSGILLAAGEILLPPQETGSAARPVLREVEEAWALAMPECRNVLADVLSRWEAASAGRERVSAAPEGLPDLYQTFRVMQGYEIWETHGEWIRREQPRFAPDIGSRFAWTQTVTRDEYEKRLAVRREVTSRLDGLLADGGLLVLPTVPSGPPPLGKSGEDLEAIRARTMQLCCLAGLAGLPQVTVPAGTAGGLPVGLSFIAGRGQDLRLLRWVHEAISGAETPPDTGAGAAVHREGRA